MDTQRKKIMNISGNRIHMRGAAKFVNEHIKKPLTIAEVGVADGRNSVAMLKGMDIERLYLVDHYPDYMDGPFLRKGELQEAYYNAMFINMQSFLSKITLVTKNSVFAATLFDDEFFDFVYIDGAHSYTQCKKDLETWWPKVAKGGILGGHDIGHVDFPGVAKAVEQFSKKMSKEFKSVGDSDWVIEKGQNARN